jgi:hypothetical protein
MPAACGVELLQDVFGRWLVARPRDGSASFPLGLLDEAVLRAGVAWLRRRWTERRVGGLVLLFHGPLERRWIAVAPPQQCDVGVLKARLNPPLPDPPWYLAGSLAAAEPSIDLPGPELLAPRFDGMHLIYSPGTWMDLRGVLRVGGEPLPLDLPAIVLPMPLPDVLADLSAGHPA